MSEDLRELARQALHERRPDAGTDAEVERVVIDVRIAERVEMVTLSVREGRLVVLATDGAPATSPAAHAALRWLSSDLPRTSLPPAVRRPDTPPAAGADAPPIQAAVADLTTAIVRQGTDAATTPAVADALARLGAASGSLVVARWIGRLRAALAARDEILIARLLDGAATLGREGSAERMVDRVLIELGRELLDGLTPLSIERRHLLDPSTGEILAEERGRDQPASNGPCPRVVQAGLATRGDGGRVRVVQYSVTALDAETLAKIETLAAPTLEAAFARAAPELLAADVEPVSLLQLGEGQVGRVVDAAGTPVPLARHEDSGAATALVEAAAKGKPSWMLGRWALAGDEAALVPLSCCIGGRVVRLR